MFQSKTAGSIAILIAITMLSWSGIVRAQSPASGGIDLGGQWRGTRTAAGGGGGNEFKVHSIKFDFKQSGDDLSGSYTCYSGKKATADCNNPLGNITSGKIKDGKVSIKVQALPNSLDCSFDGTVEGSKMKGTYSCYVGGSLASTGAFTIHRKE
jgi:hypothetical protein